MNTNYDRDDGLLDQIDRALEHGIPAEDTLINRLADTVPKANAAFQQDLEHKLMAQLKSPQMRNAKERSKMQLTSTALPRTATAWITSWGVTLTAIALIAAVLFGLNGVWHPSQFASPLEQDDVPVQVVIAAQEIPAGTLITAEMIGVVSLSVEDMAKLTDAQPNHNFLADPDAVIGQTAALDIFWFEPIDAGYLGEVIDPCDLPDAYCPEVPEGYFTIGLPLEVDTLQGLTIGDRVDVLASIGGELRVVAANVLLADLTPGMVTLAAPSWQHSILIWLYNSGSSYALRLHTGEASAPELDTTPVEYTFTAPEALPDGYVFDLVISLPASEGYLLSGLPASIDHIQFTGPDNRLTFWFTDLELVSVEAGTSVTIRLTQSDADILDYLIENHADVSFIPDAG